MVKLSVSLQEEIRARLPQYRVEVDTPSQAPPTSQLQPLLPSVGAPMPPMPSLMGMPPMPIPGRGGVMPYMMQRKCVCVCVCVCIDTLYYATYRVSMVCVYICVHLCTCVCVPV